MSAQSELIIEDMNNALDAAWLQLENATRDLLAFGKTEAQITLSVRIVCADVAVEVLQV